MCGELERIQSCAKGVGASLAVHGPQGGHELISLVCKMMWRCAFGTQRDYT